MMVDEKEDNVLDRLKKPTEAELSKIFDANERKALIASVGSTLQGDEFWASNYWLHHWRDTAKYEPMTINSFTPEKVKYENFVNAVAAKLEGLTTFQRYVLADYVFGFWRQNGADGVDLNEYAENMG